MRRGEGRRRRGATGGIKGRGAVEEGHRGPQRRASRQGEGALTGEWAERAPGGVALALAGQLRVTRGAVRNGARAILKGGPSVRGVGGVSEGPRRQQDLQPKRQG